ncbi:uncharacterized protein BcabD6B2_53250 [Babesia caballi]|uniref:Uncharacterized protein n=1 Tax=Babesia caballi TaxID=5871 RepID=A0AAV4M0Z6_BABCB|nr:hypothetical protein, conserved [Babesia caballi]
MYLLCSVCVLLASLPQATSFWVRNPQVSGANALRCHLSRSGHEASSHLVHAQNNGSTAVDDATHGALSGPRIDADGRIVNKKKKLYSYGELEHVDDFFVGKYHVEWTVRGVREKLRFRRRESRSPPLRTSRFTFAGIGGFLIRLWLDGLPSSLPGHVALSFLQQEHWTSLDSPLCISFQVLALAALLGGRRRLQLRKRALHVRNELVLGASADLLEVRARHLRVVRVDREQVRSRAFGEVGLREHPRNIGGGGELVGVPDVLAEHGVDGDDGVVEELDVVREDLPAHLEELHALVQPEEPHVAVGDEPHGRVGGEAFEQYAEALVGRLEVPFVSQVDCDAVCGVEVAEPRPPQPRSGVVHDVLGQGAEAAPAAPADEGAGEERVGVGVEVRRAEGPEQFPQLVEALVELAQGEELVRLVEPGLHASLVVHLQLLQVPARLLDVAASERQSALPQPGGCIPGELARNCRVNGLRSQHLARLLQGQGEVELDRQLYRRGQLSSRLHFLPQSVQLLQRFSELPEPQRQDGVVVAQLYRHGPTMRSEVLLVRLPQLGHQVLPATGDQQFQAVDEVLHGQRVVGLDRHGLLQNPQRPEETLVEQAPYLLEHAVGGAGDVDISEVSIRLQQPGSGGVQRLDG